MLFLCGLTYQLIRYYRACTSQGGIALSPWNPLLGRQQYPVRVTWRFLIRAAAYAALTTADAVPSNAGSFAQLRSASRNISARFAGMYPANCLPMRSRLATPYCNEGEPRPPYRGVPPRELLANNTCHTHPQYCLMKSGIDFSPSFGTVFKYDKLLFTCLPVIACGISAIGHNPESPGSPDGHGRISPDCWGVLC